METHTLDTRPQTGPLAFRAARTSELTQLRQLAPDPEAFDRDLIAVGRIRVLTRADRPVGAIGWVETGAARVVLRTFFVADAERGQRFGLHLFDAFLSEARLAGHRWVDIDAPSAAVPFLVRCGFHAFGPAPFFVDGRPLRGLWMTRGIAPRPATLIC